LAAAHFQQIERAGGVGFEINPRVFHTHTHACPRGQINDRIETRLLTQRQHRIFVGDIYLPKGESRASTQSPQPVGFELPVVGIVDVVYPHHHMPCIQ